MLPWFITILIFRRWNFGMEWSFIGGQEFRRSTRCDYRFAPRFPSGIARGKVFDRRSCPCGCHAFRVIRYRLIGSSCPWTSSIFNHVCFTTLFKCSGRVTRRAWPFSNFKWSPWGNNSYVEPSTISSPFEPAPRCHKNSGRFLGPFAQFFDILQKFYFKSF